MEENKIKKEWCTFGWWDGPWNFGKVVYESKNKKYVNVLYSEKQHYPPSCWETEWIKRFNTLEEAVEDYIKNKPKVDIRSKDLTDKEIREFSKEKFPSYYQKSCD